MIWKAASGVVRHACAVSLAVGIALEGVPVIPQVAWAQESSTLTVTKDASNAEVSYEAYCLMTGDVAVRDNKKTISNVRWGEGIKELFDQSFVGYGSTAQDAADYIGENLEDSTQVSSAGLATRLAKAVQDKRLTAAATLTPGTAATLTPGYYLVTTKADALQQTGSVATSPIFALVGATAVEITEKATPPTVDKLVREDSTGSWGHAADANRSQKVEYQLVATLPTNLATFSKYHVEFQDSLSEGLDYEEGSARVYVRHADETEDELASGFDVASAADGAKTKLTVEFEDVKALDLPSGAEMVAGDQVVVEYAAHLNANSVIGSTGNPNEVRLVYSNDPLGTGDGETRLVDPAVYTYRLKLHKRDRDAGDHKALQGATFSFQLKDGGSADTSSAGKYLQADGSLGDEAHAFTTDESGEIEIPRIDAGTYVLRETKAPTGYQTVPDTEVTITSTLPSSATGELSLEVASSNGTVVAEKSADSSTGLVSITVDDVKYLGMPQTGSTGFVAMIAAGCALIAVSLGMLLAHARRGRAEA